MSKSCSGACAERCPTCPKPLHKKSDLYWLSKDGCFAYDFPPWGFGFCHANPEHVPSPFDRYGTCESLNCVDFIVKWLSLSQETIAIFWRYVEEHKPELLQSLRFEVDGCIEACVICGYVVKNPDATLEPDWEKLKSYDYKTCSVYVEQKFDPTWYLTIDHSGGCLMPEFVIFDPNYNGFKIRYMKPDGELCGGGGYVSRSSLFKHIKNGGVFYICEGDQQTKFELECLRNLEDIIAKEITFEHTRQASLLAKYEANKAEKKAAELALKAKKIADHNARRHKLLPGEEEEEEVFVSFDF